MTNPAYRSGRAPHRRLAPLRSFRRPLVLLVAALSLSGGCDYRPARFAARAPVTAVADDQPIRLPQQRAFIEQLYYSDVYVRRALVQGLDPQRTPAAVDINSLDEVPRSSWYRGVADSREPLRGYVRVGPPLPPIRFPKLSRKPIQPDGQIIIDGRGLRYELQPDIADRPQMRTAAAAIASRLAWALGYRTPEVWVISTPSGERVSATHWPGGIDLGRTPIGQNRADDPNDVLPHVDRRTLRVLGMVAAWLRLIRLEPRMLRDQYVGLGGRGHVEHALVGLDGALGVAGLLELREEAADPDRERSNFFFRLATLGLSPKPTVPEEQSRWPSLGQISKVVTPEDYDPSPPFEPLDRLLAGDAYWAGKQIAAISDQTIAQALAAGELSAAEDRQQLQQVLEARRDWVAAFGFAQTTPCELVRVSLPRPGTSCGTPGRRKAGKAKCEPGPRLVLRNLAVAHGLVSAPSIRYRASFLAADGETLAEQVSIRPSSATVLVPLPPLPVAAVDYLVVQLETEQTGEWLPGRMELHLRRRSRSWTVLGIRH